MMPYLLRFTSLSLLIILSLLACTPKAGKVAQNPMHPQEPEHWKTTKPDASAPEEPIDVTLDDLVVMPQGGMGLTDTIPHYHASATKHFDLEHTEIKISFDFAKKHAPAQAIITLKPWFKSTDQLVLDAKNFEIRKVANANTGANLKYRYDGMQLFITLDKVYNRTEQVKVLIDYVARPEDRQEIGGSAAIKSDKGLYFIDPDGTDPEKPTQIWTQGETEASSRWFPTIDKPNQRCTQEIYMTVPDKYKTLSNGILVSSKKNSDGTRTDYYKMDKPHAPYLFMMTVGEFAKVSDKWRNIPVDYYVEPKYAEVAKDIYPHTVEMLEFFSNKLGYPYPWPSYSQVTVRDYVSGAMENTTAVIFGEFMQQDKRGLLDAHWLNEKIVAHEMFHHWFGDLVTCESWANLPLNEGFANYSEYLWLEHKHGREEADYHMEAEHDGFFGSNGDGGHAPIYYHYGDKEEMFDAVSYNKSGAILHMLRKYLGDEAFFAGLNHYLRKNEYTDVEADELRISMEEVCGEDLNWFFDQWFMRGGYPILEINTDYDSKTGEAILRVRQTQTLNEPNQTYVFDLPVFVDIYFKNGTRRRESVRINRREQEVRFAVGEKPILINFDAEKSLLALKTVNHTPEEWVALFQNGPLYLDRVEALEHLESLNEEQRSALLSMGLKDKSRAIRLKCLTLSRDLPSAVVRQLASTDSDPQVRAAAVEQLGKFATVADLPLLRANLADEQSWGVVAATLNVLMSVAPDSAKLYSKALHNADNPQIMATLAKIYYNSTDTSYLDWYERVAKKIDLDGAFTFMEYYQKYLLNIKNAAALDRAINFWQNTALNGSESEWRRFASTKALADTRNSYTKFAKTGNMADKAKVDEINQIIKTIKAAEKNETLLMYYEMF